MLSSQITSAELLYAAVLETGVIVDEGFVCHLAQSFYNHDERRVTHARAR